MLSPLSINVEVVSLLRFIVKPLSKFESIMNGMMGRENHLMDVVGATKIILCIPLDLLFSSRNRWHNSRRRWFQATNRPRPAATDGTIPDAVGFKQPTAPGLPWRASSIRLR